MPLVPYIDKIIPNMPPFYFTYWILIIAIVAITHEFAHGIFARKHGIKVKSTGFGFLGPFLLAFVEPDEKEMMKKKKRSQLEILAAGSFSNFVFAIIFVLLMQLFFVAAYQPAGMAYSLDYTKVNLSQISSIGNYSQESFLNLSDNDLKAINETLKVKTENASYWLTPELIKTVPYYKKAIQKQRTISAYRDSPAFEANLLGGLISIGGQKVKNPEQIAEVLSKYIPGQTAVVETTEGTYNITLAENPVNPEKGYLGIAFPQLKKGSISAFLSGATSPFFSPYIFIKARYNGQVAGFFADLFVWLILICFFVAVFNMLPVGFLDGGKFFYLSMLMLTKSKKKAGILFKISSYAVGAIFMLLILAWLLG
jgi:membrane-associated protease RseP (regulator of RpoE activity)